MRYRCHPRVKKMPSWARLGLGFNLISVQSFVNRETTEGNSGSAVEDSSRLRRRRELLNPWRPKKKRTQPSLACAWVSPCCAAVRHQPAENERRGAAEKRGSRGKVQNLFD